MASSYLNIITFLLTTLFYYLAIKPTLTLDKLQGDYKTYKTNNYIFLAIYLLLVMVIQFLVNASVISTTCGGSVSENMGAAGLFTFIPWTLIFGVVIVILTVYPGFKSAFSDVIGYYYVSTEANDLLSKLLIDANINKAIVGGPSTAATSSEDKTKLQNAADLIIKICGNTSILINQMSPNNFLDFWSLLDPLKKPDLQRSDGVYTDPKTGTTINIKEKLFNLVVSRDNIGEAMWYIYTGLLLTSIVQLKITSRGCASSPKTMEQNYKKFQENQEKVQKQQEQSTSTTYTITN